MTREEKQKAIDALKISVPIMAVTQEEFNDYIRTLNKVMDWLEQEPTTKIEESNLSQEQYLADIQSAYDCGKSVIDKVRAEIESDWQLKKYPASPFSCGLRRATEIIDKYRTESEPQESEDV